MASDYTRHIFTLVDDRDTNGFAGLFAEDGILCFGNAEPIKGPRAIQEGINQFFTTIQGLAHRTVNEWTQEDTTIAEAEVTYQLHDGKSVAVPAVTIYQRRDDLIAHYRIYVDLAPVYAG